MFGTLTQGVDGKKYRVVQGFWFKPETPERVISLIVNAYQSNSRLKFHYGDPKTKEPWGDVEVGTVGRSTGPIKIPLVIKTSRSVGGHGLLDHCIVKIEASRTAKGLKPLYDATA